MTEQSTGLSVRRAVMVEAPVERAFTVFTDGFASWWPHEYSIGAQPMQTAVIEPRQGGRMYERAADGSECVWGQVLAWEPPNRLVLTWQITHEWQPEPDPGKASELEVRFAAEGPGKTRVELEHRGFERHGEGGKAIYDTVSSDGGWGRLLEMYAKTAQG
jgi:uncharacterized protein YndB with AHSA1/START domain